MVVEHLLTSLKYFLFIICHALLQLLGEHGLTGHLVYAKSPPPPDQNGIFRVIQASDGGQVWLVPLVINLERKAIKI